MAGVRAEQVERFRRDGYLIVDGLFDTESLKPVRRRIRELAGPDAPELVKAKRQVEPRVEAGQMRTDGYAASLRKMSHMAFEDPVFWRMRGVRGSSTSSSRCSAPTSCWRRTSCS